MFPVPRLQLDHEAQKAVEQDDLGRLPGNSDLVMNGGYNLLRQGKIYDIL